MTRLLAFLCTVLCFGCAPAPGQKPAAPSRAAADLAGATTVATAAVAQPRIVFLGDSLTAGYGLEVAESYPSLIQARMRAAGYPYEVVNAGVSGDTSAGGLRRLDWALDGDVRVLVVALGGNDGLRGLPVLELKRNLDEIITRSQSKGIAVVLAGMEAPPNFGSVYTAEFRAVYRDLARLRRVPLVPFLLDGVAGNPALNIRDGIHPNPKGARIVETTVWRALEPLLLRSPR